MHPTPRRSLSSHHITFEEVHKQVHQLRDVILWDVQRGFESQSQFYDTDEASFSNRLMFTKFWFVRSSAVNKKRFCLALLEDDIPCAWALSLLLKSIWNCHPKDAVASQSQVTVFSSYDQTPMDHNRAVVPFEMLVEVVEADRIFFRTLDAVQSPSDISELWRWSQISEQRLYCQGNKVHVPILVTTSTAPIYLMATGRQAVFMSELLKISGGPIVWAVFNKAQAIFESYREDQLDHLQDIVAVIENQESSVKFSKHTLGDNKGKKIAPPNEPPTGNGNGGTPLTILRAAERELEVCLARWTSIIKSIQDSQKLEEVELSFSDGTKKRIWKINRPKPEVTETVGHIELLPLAVAKRILYFLPREQLADCARINRYWAYMVEEFKSELDARLKIDSEIEKMTEIMLGHDPLNLSMDTFKTSTDMSFSAPVSRHSRKLARGNYNPASQKSGPNVFKCILRDRKIKLPPIRNLAELSDRLDRRGAADDSLKDWCKAVLEQYKPKSPGVSLPPLKSSRSPTCGVMDLSNVVFPCPLMSMSLPLPLKSPLCKDPTATFMNKKKKSNINASGGGMQLGRKFTKRFNLWSRDFSSLYSAAKIPSYKSPV